MSLLDELKSLPKDRLIDIFTLFNKNWWTVDGLWFRVVEEEFGLDAAWKVNFKVSERMAPIMAKRILKFLGFKGEKISELVEALKFLPWSAVQGAEVKILGEDEAILSVVECKPQKFRVKNGLKEFPCKDLGLRFFARFAEAVNPKIRVECLTAPPNPHPNNLWCQWRFKLEK
ncbi:hypothetical protein DRO30_03010 [Candidatus Bathyarchaeota archaeon]|nr:MAG: hypothetical protein DRO30_03010 [Candidatus Bathyarchaeota archaeon]RLI33166.1 MAG: hypothetical protein DRO51_00030 [Candidatus Bathyarchaeota archaeon]